MDDQALTDPALSIVVETWNADQEVPAKLRRLLAALERQTLPFARMEVVIAADAAWAQELQPLADEHPNVVVVSLRATGVFSMNNAALTRATRRGITASPPLTPGLPPPP